jgi:hypothetical protein
VFCTSLGLGSVAARTLAVGDRWERVVRSCAGISRVYRHGPLLIALQGADEGSSQDGLGQQSKSERSLHGGHLVRDAKLW